ncbi:hypothetical protein BOW37_01605 [Solemya velum gill symbiont]|uniref:YhdP family phospholipid transporter n=1 Tax=Solemya velum gill symbiont TaxID=2340 RepID=UPI000995EA54|nr:AsmA-like C-terminal region-containing protein [Solemya velum gill symbiont]OOZ46119.1 hypothetical protein BOW37_01605 [Solemya velum gill symbiont]OOZ47568.1 hypothetical protein BOW38_01555 [Solemya velum gill symbiont]OOZ52654.1 hypothetical protein BOW40_02250 [Solemya velum gill symbiont]OOZ55692.1 hypothetical protein BOW41_01565 [Solemya velum gill symbiont]OOZ62389.1 hypothetical protein BOW44_02455 [Solemya velum gill symbiont]
MRYLVNPFVFLLVLFALLISAARILVPLYIENNQEAILESLSEQSGYRISADRISCNWAGTGPIVRLHQFTVLDKSGSAIVLQADSIQFHLSIIDLLEHQNIVPKSAIIDGMSLSLVRDSSGDFSVYGVERPVDDTPPDYAEISRLLFQPESLALSNARIVFIDLFKSNRITRFEPASLVLVNNGNKHQLRATLGFDKKDLGEMTLSTEFKTPDKSLQEWEGSIHLITSQLDLAWLVGDKIPGHYGIENGSSSFELWSDWKAGQMTRLQGRFTANKVAFISPDVGAPRLSVDWASGNFCWHHEEHGWRIDLANMKVSSNGSEWPTRSLGFALRKEQEDAPYTLFLGADAFNIENLITALKFRTIDSRTLDHLFATFPKGHASDILLGIRMEHPLEWQFSAKLENLGLLAVNKIPGFSNISGQIDAGHNGGHLTLDTNKASVEFKGLFRKPIAIGSLKGEIQWFPRDGGMLIASNRIMINNDDLDTEHAFRLTTREEKTPLLDYLGKVSHAEIPSAPAYYPVGIMKPNLVSWLEKSLQGGELSNGKARIKGPLDHFPAKLAEEDIFDFRFDVDGMRLDYREEWPSIEELQANVHFHRNSMTINASAGKIYDSQVAETTARIESLKPLTPLQVTGRIEGAIQDPLRLLRESPLSHRFGKFANTIKAEGESLLAIDLSIPLKKSHPKTQFEGSLALDGNQLQFNHSDIPIERISGVLHMTQDGLLAEKIKATALGAELLADISPAKNGGIEIRSNTLINVERLKQHLPVLKAVPISGESEWDVKVLIPPLESKGQVRLNAASKLVGTEVVLPLHLYKTPKQKRSTSVSLPLTQDNPPVDIQYGENEINIVSGGQGGTIFSPKIGGAFTFPINKKSPFIAEFAYLKLRFEANNGGKSVIKKSSLDPRNAPLLLISSESLEINDVPYGSLQLATKRIKNGMQLSALEIANENLHINSSGTWTKNGTKQESRIEASITADDLGKALKGLGITEQIEQSPGTFTVNLNWPGTPDDFAFESLEGKIKVKSGKGRLSDAKPGFGRFIGLVNLRALQRRLSLDFSDFTKEGFGFDKISGKAVLASGIATTENLKISAPAGDILIKGKTNLKTRELDQVITVKPKLHGTLPLAGTLAGGPVVGAALLLAGAIAGDKIDRIAETKYIVTGSWDDPLIERMGKQQESNQQEAELNEKKEEKKEKKEKTDSHGLPVFD